MLKLENISKSFNGKEIFSDINFILNDNEKLGLIGRNGCGKSTLLKIISGELEKDDGNIITSKNYRIGYLQQHLQFKEKTILDEVCSALPEYKQDNFWEVEKILQDIGFLMEDLNRSPDEFSGGWQIRLNLAKLLVAEPDLLLLDEPTNYLDIISIRWLKQFLKEWKKSFILITHDRVFLNDVITHTLIIHRGTSKKITGNVDQMYEQIAIDEENYEKTRLNENKKREQIEKYINRFRYKATLAKQVQSKIKMLDKQEQKEKLDDIQDLEFDFNYKNIITNKPFIEVANLTFGYEKDNILIKDFNFKVEKGDKICVIGKNGKGKSTLLKLLIGELYQNSGNIDINNKVDIGYFGQMNINRLNLENTIEEELWEIDKTLSRNKILNIAGTMMFTGDDYKKRLSVLSGGEKSRVLLGKIILKPCNLLLSDEPTNHLDMESCISLMEAINNFAGASVTITHNEDFLNNVANKLIVFDDDKTFVFEGGYQDFLREIGWSNEEEIKEVKVKSEKVINTVENNKNNKKIDKNFLKKKEKLENEIFKLELKMEEMILGGNYNVADLQKKIDVKTAELEEMVK
ncbi:MAG: ABC-F family ATP-binding cassette domain-containing protein [Rickettsiales bacterium]|nr:ABC-F family ATP-binding cassette domain-containing protein [Rickettsiales bacterium]